MKQYVVEIRAGEGGEDAKLLVNTLYNMYKNNSKECL